MFQNVKKLPKATTLDRLRFWLKEIDSVWPVNKLKITIVGNKIDLIKKGPDFDEFVKALKEDLHDLLD